MLDDLRRRIKRLENLVMLALGGSGAGALAHAWGETGISGFRIVNGTPGIAASASITPKSTGKVVATITGALENVSDSGTADVQVSITLGSGSLVAIYTQGGTTVPSPSGSGGGPIALVVDLGVIGHVLPVGSATIVNAMVTVRSGGQAVSGAQHAVQVDLAEHA